MFKLCNMLAFTPELIIMKDKQNCIMTDLIVTHLLFDKAHSASLST